MLDPPFKDRVSPDELLDVAATILAMAGFGGKFIKCKINCNKRAVADTLWRC